MDPSSLLSPEKKAFKEYLNSICSALGGFEKTTEQIDARIKASPAYRNGFLYVPGDECLECIKDLRKLMRQEERSLEKPTRLLLAEWNTFSEDLLPILALHTDFLNDTLVELIAYMMTPIVNRPFSNNVTKEIKEEEEMLADVKDSTNYDDEEQNDYEDESGDDKSAYQDDDYVSSEDEEAPKKLVSADIAIKEHRFHQLRYKQTLLLNKWFFFHLIEQASILLAIPAWSEDDERFLFTMLTLVRSLLTLENPQESNIQSSHDLLLERLQECHCLDLILVLVASVKDYKFQPYTWLFLDIIFSIFRHVDFDNLCLSVQPDGKIAENVSSLQQNGLKQQVKSDQACTLSEIISKSTRHSKFGGTNTLHLAKGKKANFFSSNGNKKVVLSGPGLADLKVTSPEALLDLLQLRRGDSHIKRVTKKVDIDAHRYVMHGPTRRLLLDFVFQFACGASVSLFEATQKKSLKSTNDDRGREISVLTLTLKLAHHYITVAQDWSIVRAILPLLSSSTLPHYIMSSISDFKDSKSFKALSVGLNCLRSWLVLIIALHKLPDTFVSINNNPEDSEETRTILQQLQQVGHHHLHNFVHDYALLRPLHDLYGSPYYHPSILSSLIPTTFYLNQAVKLAILYRKGDLFARTRKPKRTKRSKKTESSKKRKKQDKVPTKEMIEDVSEKSPAPLEISKSPKETSGLSPTPLEILKSPKETYDKSPTPLENPKSPKKTTVKIDDPLAALFSDDDEDPPNPEKNEEQPIEKNNPTEDLDSDKDFISSEEEVNEQSDDDSDSEDESTREFNERTLDFKKYLQTYTNEGVINGHMIYLERILAQAGSPGMMLNQPDLHFQLNNQLQMITTMLHQLVVQLECTRLLYRASYLHSLHNAANQCRAISAAFLAPSPSGKLVIKLPSSLRWISELEKFVNFSFSKILETLKADPWFLETLLPKSASKKLKSALLKPVTPPHIEDSESFNNNIDLSTDKATTSFNHNESVTSFSQPITKNIEISSAPKSTEAQSASSASKVASGSLSPSTKNVTNGCISTKNNFVDEFSDDFLEDLFA